jgi:hypothetical protein
MRAGAQPAALVWNDSHSDSQVGGRLIAMVKFSHADASRLAVTARALASTGGAQALQRVGEHPDTYHPGIMTLPRQRSRGIPPALQPTFSTAHRPVSFLIVNEVSSAYSYFAPTLLSRLPLPSNRRFHRRGFLTSAKHVHFAVALALEEVRHTLRLRAMLRPVALAPPLSKTRDVG